MYFLCSQAGHYVTVHRGEILHAGSKCPVVTSSRCQGRLSPAPVEEEVTRCRRCGRGIPIPSAAVGPVCCFCGAQTATRGLGVK